MHHPSVFKSFFLGGFECSNHRRSDGRRLDLLAARLREVEDEDVEGHCWPGAC